MVRHLSAALLSVVALSTEAFARERNYTLRGEGWFDTGTERFGRLPLREARLTLRDNGEFAVTLFVRNERYLVQGSWDRRNRGELERIDINNAFGQRASGSGTLAYRADAEQPQRLALEGRTGDATFRAEIADARSDGWDNRDAPDRRNDRDLGRGNKLFRDIDASMNGSGTLRLSGVRDGRLENVRARLGTDGDVRLEFGSPTRGSVRAEITDIRDNRITARVREVFGYRASGEVVIAMRDRDNVERVNGSGGGDNGSWQLDFDGRSRGNGSWDDDDNRWGRGDNRDERGRGGMDASERGSGWLRQDRGPSLSFDRMRVTLDDNHDALIQLEGRRQVLRLRGRWSGRGDGVRVELTQVNELRARGRVDIARDGWRVQSLRGDGRTDLGTFDVRFVR